MTECSFDVCIVGAGHAGAQAAIALRQEGFEGSVVMIGAEDEFPYERPPLSKDYLTGGKAFERMLIRPPAFWKERSIDLRLGERVDLIDPNAKTVGTSTGDVVRYGSLIWATGGEPRRLTCAGNDLAGVHTVRAKADIDALLTELTEAGEIVMIGGGYIGLEAAAALSKMGKSITLLESLDRVLARVAGGALSRFFEDEHRRHSVTLLLNSTVDCIEGNGRVTGVRLCDGTRLKVDIVIVGIGIVPAIEPLAVAGAEICNGVIVDERCRTSLPGVYAVGDCAAHANAFAGGATIRLESVQNANDQAVTAVRDIVGRPTSYDSVPWFWSNQYDLRLQTVGLSAGHDEAVLRGDPATRSFSVVYLREGAVVAIDAVNAVKDYVQGRALVTERARLAPQDLADTTRALKELPRCG